MPTDMSGETTRIRALVLALLLVLPCGGATAARAATVDPARVAAIKAAYVFHMLQLTRWPDLGGDRGEAVRILFVGRDAEPVAAALAPNLGPVRIQGHPLVIDRVAALTGPETSVSAAERLLSRASCVYVGTDAAECLPLLAAGFGTQPVLVAGDGPDVARVGGMVGFYVDDERVRIRVNLDRVHGAGLRMSAEFIQHVEVVRDREGE
jgi:hypothetical protein